MEQVFPRLEMTAGPDEGLLVALKEGEQTLGRVNGVEIYLPDTSISRRHATIKMKESFITIRDLGSRNGTLVNGKPLSAGVEYPLDHLAHIQVGIYEWRLMVRAATPEEIVKKDQKPEVSAIQNKEPSIQEDPSQVTNNESLKDDSSSMGTPASETQEDNSKDHNVGATAASSDGTELQAEEPKNKLERQASNALIEKPATDLMLSENRSKKNILIAVVLSVFLILVLGFILRDPLKDKLIELGILSAPSIENEENTNPLSQPLIPTQNNSVKNEGEDAPIKEETVAFNELKALPETDPLQNKPDQQQRDIFFDVRSEPIPARVTFRDLTLGVTPLKSPATLKFGEEYELIAEFDLRDIRDRYQMKHVFKLPPNGDVISHLFKAPIGVIKIQKLPRNVDFYLEGYYAYDKYKSNPVRLSDITYGKPVYTPFGHYIVELREKVKVGDSDTLVTEIRYHREFDLSDKQSSIDLSIEDSDLESFPAKINSIPAGAVIFVDEKEVGKTPYEGALPLGEHSLRLSREGYFDYKNKINMRTNTPYESTIKLETSKVGQFINRAKEQRRIGQNQIALNELVEALKQETTGMERAEINVLLGEISVDTKDYTQALKYFNLAKESAEYKYRAVLGLAKVAFYSGQTGESMKLVVEVLINLPEKDPVVKEAKSLFAQLSSLKSVIYIATNPVGASVIVNGQPVNQLTPVILTDLGLGVYRFEIKKAGFKTQQVKKSLKLNEFEPIIITLEPESL